MYSTKFLNNSNAEHQPFHQDQYSDLEARQTPQPINFPQTQSQVPSSLNEFKTQTEPNLNNRFQIQYLWKNWRYNLNVSLHSITTLNHILENIECSDQDLILVYYLKQRVEVKGLEKKIRNARINMEYCELNQSDDKKLLLLKLLVDKLEKKIVFEVMLLRKYGKRMLEVERLRKKRLIDQENYIKAIQIIERMRRQRLKQGIMNILNESKLKKLLSSEQSQRKFSTVLNSSQSNDDSLDYQFKEQTSPHKIYQKQVESQEYYEKNTLFNTVNDDNGNVFSNDYSASDIIVTIRRLEGESKLIKRKYMKREEKLKRLYFIVWKIAFLYKQMEAILVDNNNHKIKQMCFNLMKNQRGKRKVKIQQTQKIKAKQTKAQQHQDQEKANYTNNRQTKIQKDPFDDVDQNDKLTKLKSKLKAKHLKTSMERIKERTNVSKINRYVKQIHNENIVRKTFKALKDREIQLTNELKQDQKQQYQVDNQQYSPHHQFQQERQSYHQSYQQKQTHNKHQSYIKINSTRALPPSQILLAQTSRYTTTSNANDPVLSLTEQQQFQIRIFRKAHLQTKFFFILKNILCFSKLFKSAHILIVKQGFEGIKRVAKEKEAMEDRVERYQTRRNKIILFRYFRGIKELVVGSKNERVEVYVKYKSKLLLENSFSAMKLEWKQALVKVKKASLVLGYMRKRNTIDRFKEVLLPSLQLSTKTKILLTKRISKNSRVFLKNLLSNYLLAKKQEQKTSATHRQIEESKARLMSSCFEAWNILYHQRKHTRKSLTEYYQQKQHNLKKKVFWLWMRMALLRKKNMISLIDEQSGLEEKDSKEVSVVSKGEEFKLERSSREHKFWLEKYYQQICSFDN